MKKKILIMTALVLASIGVIIGVSFFDFSSTGEIYYEELDITANITANGDLKVTEQWNIRFEEEAQNVYRTFDFTGYKCELVDISVTDDDSGESLFFYKDFHYSGSSSITRRDYGSYYFDTTNNENGGEFGIIIEPDSMVNRHFTVNYTIKNAVVQYDDVADFYWKILSEDFEAYIKNFSLTINLPSGANSTDESTLAFYHCQNKYAQYTFEGETVNYTAKKLYAGTMVEPRIIFSPSVFSDVVDVRSGAQLEAITQEEDNNINEWNELLDKQEIVFILDIVVCVLVYVISVGTTIAINIFNRRTKGEYPEYVREIPDGWTAGEMGIPYYYYDGGIENSQNRGRVLSATVLELARRGYITLAPCNGDNKEGYTIEVLSDITDSQIADLKPHEMELRNLFLALQNDVGHPFTMQEFETYAQAHYSLVNSRLKSFVKKVADKFNGGGYRGTGTKVAKYMPLAGIVMIIIAVALFTLVSEYVTFSPIALVAGGLLFFIGQPKAVKLNKKGEELYEQIHGLERFMKDFSNLKDYDVPQLVLWEEYLVYATMMGISEQVLKQLKLVYPELSEAAGSLNYDETFRHRSYLFTYVWISGNMHRNGFAPSSGMFDIGSGMERSLSRINDTVVRLAEPRSSGRSGGGSSGFGHGGGGTGGGGGGFGGGGGGFR